MIYELAKGKIWKLKEIEKMNVHKTHLFMAYKIDDRKLKYKLSQGANTIQL